MQLKDINRTLRKTHLGKSNEKKQLGLFEQ